MWPKGRLSHLLRLVPLSHKCKAKNRGTSETMTKIESQVKHVLTTVFEAYRNVLGSESWSIVPFDVDISNDKVSISLSHQGKVRTFSGRLSALGFLSGRYWAAAYFCDELLEICPTWLPTLSTTTPNYLRAVVQSDYGTIQKNEEFKNAMRDAGRVFLEAGQQEEAILCFRRSSDMIFDVVQESVVPSELKARVAGVTNAVKGKGTTVSSFSKSLLQWLDSELPEERMCAIRAIHGPMGELTYSNRLRLFKAFRDPLARVCNDQIDAVRELGLGLAEIWSDKLWEVSAYVEALVVLNPLVESNVRLRDSLLQRWECRLALEMDSDAEADFERAKKLIEAPLPMLNNLSIDHTFFAWGDLTDYRAAGLTRVAEACLSWAEGIDPCEDRRIRVPKPPSPKRQQQLLDRASKLLEEAVAIAEDRVWTPSQSGESRSYHAKTFCVLAKAHEMKGSMNEAFASISKARDMALKLGLSFQTTYSHEYDRLRQAVSTI